VVGESPEQGALRETYEEAGIIGEIEFKLGVFTDSKRNRTHYFLLIVCSSILFHSHLITPKIRSVALFSQSTFGFIFNSCVRVSVLLCDMKCRQNKKWMTIMRYFFEDVRGFLSKKLLRCSLGVPFSIKFSAYTCSYVHSLRF
jgi:ADP-ribose pyrophosphatase YjhB (NUDIX family)